MSTPTRGDSRSGLDRATTVTSGSGGSLDLLTEPFLEGPPR
jgi:hypothetical protein